MLVYLRLLLLGAGALELFEVTALPLVVLRWRLVVGESTRSFVVELDGSAIGSGVRNTGEFTAAKKSPTVSKLKDGEVQGEWWY